MIVPHRPPRSADGGPDGGGRGASAGRASGTAWDGAGRRRPTPYWSYGPSIPARPLLPSLGGLVAQTGSPLSHLAVLAREFRLPAVVGWPTPYGAFRRAHG
ncbi:PEP-utilizing enzyme [Streptomyces sp. M19]